MRLLSLLILFLLSFSTAHVDSSAAEEQAPVIPNFWDSRVRLDKPTDTARTIRFLASDDFPPFAFRDPAGRLTGFNVDLARAICEELDAICTLRVKPFAELLPALEGGEGDAVIAGLEPGAKIGIDAKVTGDGDAGGTKGNGDRNAPADAADKEAEGDDAVIYTAPYLKLPARFVVRKEDASDAPLLPETLTGKWISVASGSTHAAFLNRFFPGAHIATYVDEEHARNALRLGDVDAHFGDGLGLSYWLQGTSSVACCVFAPGPWLEPGYFDHGLAIAVRGKDEDLRAAIDYALQQVHDDGRFGELYLRYFPISFY